MVTTISISGTGTCQEKALSVSLANYCLSFFVHGISMHAQIQVGRLDTASEVQNSFLQ